MCHQNFTFSSSSRLLFQFPIQKLGRFSSSLLYHTTPQRFFFAWRKRPKMEKIEKTQPTHTRTTAAAERALQFNMFCETLAGVGKMEMERHKGSGEMSIENWIHNLISLTSAQNVAFLFVARQGEEEESCSQFGTDWSKFNSRRTHTQQQQQQQQLSFFF